MHKVSHISLASFGSTCWNVWPHDEQFQEHTQEQDWDKVHPCQLLKRSNVSKRQHLDGPVDA